MNLALLDDFTPPIWHNVSNASDPNGICCKPGDICISIGSNYYMYISESNFFKHWIHFFSLHNRNKNVCTLHYVCCDPRVGVKPVLLQKLYTQQQNPAELMTYDEQLLSSSSSSYYCKAKAYTFWSIESCLGIIFFFFVECQMKPRRFILYELYSLPAFKQCYFEHGVSVMSAPTSTNYFNSSTLQLIIDIISINSISNLTLGMISSFLFTSFWLYFSFCHSVSHVPVMC